MTQSARGSAPTALEEKYFAEDKDSKKREKLLDLLLKDPAGSFYLHLYDGWVSAESLDGPWAIAPSPPGTLELEQAARASGRSGQPAG